MSRTATTASPSLIQPLPYADVMEGKPHGFDQSLHRPRRLGVTEHETVNTAIKVVCHHPSVCPHHMLVGALHGQRHQYSRRRMPTLRGSCGCQSPHEFSHARYVHRDMLLFKQEEIVIRMTGTNAALE